MHPYRSAAKPEEPDGTCEGSDSRWELLLPFAVLWFVSIPRVVLAALGRHAFDTDDTLALVTILFLPWLLFGRRAGRRA
jgi:hypothetical protein